MYKSRLFPEKSNISVSPIRDRCGAIARRDDLIRTNNTPLIITPNRPRVRGGGVRASGRKSGWRAADSAGENWYDKYISAARGPPRGAPRQRGARPRRGAESPCRRVSIFVGFVSQYINLHVPGVGGIRYTIRARLRVFVSFFGTSAFSGCASPFDGFELGFLDERILNYGVLMCGMRVRC